MFRIPRSATTLFGCMTLAVLGLAARSVTQTNGSRPDPAHLTVLLGMAVFGLTTLALSAIRGRRCPACGRPSLRRARQGRWIDAMRRFGCASCRGRFRLLPDGSYRDASGPADASFFEPRSAAGRWMTAGRPGADGSTSGQLLKRKRLGHLKPPEPDPMPRPPREPIRAHPALPYDPDSGLLDRLLARKRQLGRSHRSGSRDDD